MDTLEKILKNIEDKNWQEIEKEDDLYYNINKIY